VAPESELAAYTQFSETGLPVYGVLGSWNRDAIFLCPYGRVAEAVIAQLTQR
jgi:hypothetical protein